MATGSAATAGRCKLQADGYLPDAEFNARLVDQFRPVTGMGLVADATGAPLAAIHDVNIVEVAVTIPEIRENRGIRVTEEILFMTFKTEIVLPPLKRRI